MGNRPLGDCVFGERSKPKTVERNTLQGNVRWTTDRWAVVFSASEARRKQRGGTRIDYTKLPLLSATPTGGGVGISTRFPLLRDEGKPRPYNVNVFLVLPMR
ncbi:MAG: hypothetical protein LBQ66_06155, partial [Planctomycetaceae bacterium]|nr:hypothetical protein [Planctomycetaceae bacterium]